MPREFTTELSALTRVQWRGNVLADDGVDPDDLTEAVYDHVDGGDYEEDPHFWEQGESCETVPADPPVTGTIRLVACADADGEVQVRDVQPGEAPLDALAKLKQELTCE